jgi:hypothetical protein
LTVKSREDRSTVVKNTAVSSPLWQLNADLKSSGTALVQAGIDLAAGESLLQSLLSQADAAEKEVASLRITWDERFNVYAGNAELAAIKPEDITNLGLTLLEESSYKLAPALAVTARYDLITSHIRILVRKPPGAFGCRIEISPNPIVPGSFQPLKGHGARRAVPGYPPGSWWVRAVITDNESESDPSPPVFVTIP